MAAGIWTITDLKAEYATYNDLRARDAEVPTQHFHLAMAMQMAGQRDGSEAAYDTFCKQACLKFGGYGHALAHYSHIHTMKLQRGGQRKTDRDVYNAEKMVSTLQKWKERKDNKKSGCAIQ